MTSLATPPTSRTTQLALVLTAVVVGIALKIANGNYHPAAIVLLGGALAVILTVVAGVRFAWLERQSLRWLLIAAVIAAAVSLVALLIAPIVPPSTSVASEVPMYRLLEMCGVTPPVDTPQSSAPAVILLILCAVAGAWAVFAPQRIARVVMPLALLLHFAALAMSISAAPAPVMDVLVFEHAAPQQLMAGENPYAMTFPDLSAGTSPLYGPGLQANGELLFGFPYPPLSLFWLMPTFLAGMLAQYMHAIAFTAAAALIAYARPGPLPKAAALLLMLMPVGPFVICNGWTEPLVSLMLALTVFLACRKPEWTGGGLGLFWSAKQYVPLLIPLSLLLVEQKPAKNHWLRLLAIAAITGAIVTLPLVLWDIGAFWHSAIDVQLRQPFRTDALSFLAAVYHATGAMPPSWITFIVLVFVQALCLWKCPRTPAGFALATAASLLAFFAFSKQAFAGYYFLVVAACACGLAASDEGTQDAPAVRGFIVKRKSSGGFAHGRPGGGGGV